MGARMRAEIFETYDPPKIISLLGKEAPSVYHEAGANTQKNCVLFATWKDDFGEIRAAGLRS